MIKYDWLNNKVCTWLNLILSEIPKENVNNSDFGWESLRDLQYTSASDTFRNVAMCEIKLFHSHRYISSVSSLRIWGAIVPCWSILCVCVHVQSLCLGLVVAKRHLSGRCAAVVCGDSGKSALVIFVGRCRHFKRRPQGHRQTERADSSPSPYGGAAVLFSSHKVKCSPSFLTAHWQSLFLITAICGHFFPGSPDG